MPKSFSPPRKVVFFFPSFASSEATAPLGILAVATPLIRAGYQVVLVDSTITPDYKKRVLEEVRDAVCLGISLVTGPMIRETVEIARAVKEWNPDFPIILGGWHPSLLPDQTLQAACVDYVVRGQGEDALLGTGPASGKQLRAGSNSRHRLQAGRQTHPYTGAPAEAAGRDASEGVSHRRLRCL